MIGRGVQRGAPLSSRGGRIAATADADRSCGRPQRAACLTVKHRRLRMKTRHLLSGVAVIAALAFSAPVWAQPANPSGGNSTGAPPPSSLSSPRGTVHMPAPSGQMPAGGRATSEPTNIPSTTSASDTSSAMPPKHHHAHASAHGKVASHHPSRFPHVQGNNSANALNQAELARLQTGSSMPPPPMGAMPPPAPMPSPSGGNSLGQPGPNAGGPGLTPYSTGAPQR